MVCLILFVYDYYDYASIIISVSLINYHWPISKLIASCMIGDVYIILLVSSSSSSITMILIESLGIIYICDITCVSGYDLYMYVGPRSSPLKCVSETMRVLN